MLSFLALLARMFAAMRDNSLWDSSDISNASLIISCWRLSPHPSSKPLTLFVSVTTLITCSGVFS